MPKSRTSRTIYRDSKTGRFSSKDSWKAAKARGSSRYRRQQVPIRKPISLPPPIPIPPGEPTEGPGGGGGGGVVLPPSGPIDSLDDYEQEELMDLYDEYEGAEDYE